MQLDLGFDNQLVMYKRDVFLYSTAICPPNNCVEEIDLMKVELFNEAGWFGSKGSKAHNTLNVFQATNKELTIVETFIELFCLQFKPIELSFTRLSHYEGSNALIILPNESTEELLRPIMQRFKKGFPFDSQFSINPHISIGRNLSEEQLEKAYLLFKNRQISILFVWDNIAIRKFNPKIRQYEIYKRFDF